jgi:hypothetical protein
VRAAVAAAALIYGGIHDEIRRNGYDTIHRRARTSTARKLMLAARAAWRLRRPSAAAVAAARHGPGVRACPSPGAGEAGVV